MINLTFTSLIYFVAFAIIFYNLLLLIKKRYDYLVEANQDAVKSKIDLKAAIAWTKDRQMALGGILGLLGAFIGLHLGLGVIAGPIAGAAVLGLGPIIFMRIRDNRIKKRLQGQVVQMLNLIASSMRSGKTLPQAITQVSETIGGPIGRELKLASRQILVGIKPDSALKMLEKRINVPEISLAIKAMIVSLSTGANLPIAITNIANTITARDRLERKISALTAQGRLQAIIMGLAPFVLLTFFYIMSPGYYGVMFTTTLGNIILGIVIILQIIAYFTINQIIKVKI